MVYILYLSSFYRVHRAEKGQQKETCVRQLMKELFAHTSLSSVHLSLATWPLQMALMMSLESKRTLGKFQAKCAIIFHKKTFWAFKVGSMFVLALNPLCKQFHDESYSFNAAQEMFLVSLVST